MTNKNDLQKERREFLKASALVAGGVMMSGYAWAGVNSAVDDTIKIALIGCGDRGTGAAFQALSTKSNLKLVAMADAFQDRLDINPLQATLKQLKETANRVGLNLDLGDDRLGYMDLLFSHFVEPSLGFDAPVFLTDFPPEMASLAKVKTDEDGELVAARFEVYIEGLELANAYDELLDTDVLAGRFDADNAERAQQGLPVIPTDQYLLAALPHMPECSGIALGIDRLLMVAMNKMKIDQVIAFPAEIA